VVYQALVKAIQQADRLISYVFWSARLLRITQLNQRWTL
jgi:hypothetical protein